MFLLQIICGIICFNRHFSDAQSSIGVPKLMQSVWGKEEPRHEVKAYQPDAPTEYSERRRVAKQQIASVVQQIEKSQKTV